MCVYFLNCPKLHSCAGAFSSISNNQVDSLLTNSKVGGREHNVAVRGGIIELWGGYRIMEVAHLVLRKMRPRA